MLESMDARESLRWISRRTLQRPPRRPFRLSLPVSWPPSLWLVRDLTARAKSVIFLFLSVAEPA